MKKASLPDIKVGISRECNIRMVVFSSCFLHKYSHLLNYDRTLTGFEKAKRWLRYCMDITAQ